MIVLENECVGCPPERGCLGNACPYRNVVRFYCDHCGEEIELDIFDDEPEEFDGKHYCNECLLELGYMEDNEDGEEE